MLKRQLLTLGAFASLAPLAFVLVIALVFNHNQLTEIKDGEMPANSFSNLFRSFQKGTGQVKGVATSDDARSPIIKKFFRKYNSPLASLSEYIVDKADQYGIDYRLIPAISMQESTGCKFIPENSYNCWGYGIYGNKVTRFQNYEEAIDTVSRGLKKNYYDKGLREPHQIMAKYTPPSTGSWANGVNYFFDEIEAGTY